MTALILLVLGFAAGCLGALAGVGGGILLVPVMNTGLGIDFRIAVATSLVAVVATSTGTSARYLSKDLCDIRVGMILEVATVAGAIGGGLVVTLLPVDGLRILFAVMALYLAGWQLWSARYRPENPTPDSTDGVNPERPPAKNYGAGFVVSGVAGFISAILGVGGGVLKVPVMNMVMGMPFRVALATSNYMIGVTAAASALVYFRRGQIDLAVVAPTVVGVLGGAALGARLMPKVRIGPLRVIFASVLVVIAIQMAWRGLEFPSLFP